MPNKTYAKEWIFFSKRNLDTAKVLLKANHYEDIIGIELQQTLEKLLKAIIANDNMKIPRDHDLVKLYFIIDNFLILSEEEIQDVLNFTENLLEKVCEILKIDTDEIKK